MLTIVGEKINTVNAKVLQAVEGRDAEFIRSLARAQAQAGADVIDVNVGTPLGLEPDHMRWAVEVIQETTDLPLAIDSPHPGTILEGLRACHRRQQAWVNSVTLEQARCQALLPIVATEQCSLIALCMDERGVPSDPAGRLRVAAELVDEAKEYGVALDRLYLDALVEPISVRPQAVLITLRTIQAIRQELPGVKTIACLSAISFGLPARRLIHRVCLPLLLRAGLDAVILDPLDSQLMATLKASQALLGNDPHGLEYIAAYNATHFGAREGN